MVIQCPHCGAMLPRNGARFCNHCGSSISTQQQWPLSDTTSAHEPPSQPSSSTSHQEEQKPGLREQVAQQPGPLPPGLDEMPSWMRKLDSNDPKKTLPGISMDDEDAANQTLLSGGWQVASAHGLGEDYPTLVEPQIDEITDPAPATLEKAVLAQQPSASEEPQPSSSGGVLEPQMQNESAKSVIDGAQQPASLENQLQENALASRSQFAGRELRVKVWDQEHDALLAAPNAAYAPPSDGVEDLPTQMMVAPDLLNAASRPVPMPAEPVHEEIEDLDTVQIASKPVREQIEQADTAEFTAYPASGPTATNPPSPGTQPANQQVSMNGIASQPTQRPPSLPGIAPTPVQRQPSQPGIAPLPVQRQPSQPGITPTPASRPPSLPGIAPVPMPGMAPLSAQRGISSPGIPMQGPPLDVRPPALATPPPGVQPAVITSTASARRNKTRLPLIAALILVPVLLLGGLAFWIVQTQRMNDLAVTQPWLQLQDQKLGVAFSYPNGWQTQADYAKSVLHLHDSSNTAQVNVTVTKAPGGDLAQYLSQQAKQMQIADAKAGAPVSFAHASWTQIQGATQQAGANYTTTLLATVHNNRLFTITLLAPASNYADQENVNFSHLRGSWRFL